MGAEGKSTPWQQSFMCHRQTALEKPQPKEVQDKCYCNLIGAVFISEIRTPEQCNAYSWAKGPECHIISHTCTLAEPVSIQKPNAAAVRWTIKNEDEKKLIEAQLPDIYPKPIDLTPLNGTGASCSQTPPPTAARDSPASASHGS